MEKHAILCSIAIAFLMAASSVIGQFESVSRDGYDFSVSQTQVNPSTISKLCLSGVQ